MHAQWMELVSTINILDDGDEVISDLNFYLISINSSQEVPFSNLYIVDSTLGIQL